MQGPQGSRARDGRVSISTISSNTRFISAAHADGRNCPGSTRIWWRRSGRRARISLGGAPSVPREVSGIWVSPAPQSPQSRLLLPPPLSCSPIVLCTSIHVFAASVRLTDCRHFCQITLERRLAGGQGRAGEVTHPVLRNVALFGSITFIPPSHFLSSAAKKLPRRLIWLRRASALLILGTACISRHVDRTTSGPLIARSRFCRTPPSLTGQRHGRGRGRARLLHEVSTELRVPAAFPFTRVRHTYTMQNGPPHGFKHTYSGTDIRVKSPRSSHPHAVPLASTGSAGAPPRLLAAV